MTIFALDTAQNGTKVTESTTGKTVRTNGERSFLEIGDGVLSQTNNGACTFPPSQCPVRDIVWVYTHNLSVYPESCSDFVTHPSLSPHDAFGESIVLRLFAVEQLIEAESLARRRGCALVDRVLARIAQAESREAEAWYVTDYRVAWLTLFYAFQGNADSYDRACYQVSGHHADKLAEIIRAKSAQLANELACPELIEQFKRDYKPPRIGPRSVRAKAERIAR